MQQIRLDPFKLKPDDEPGIRTLEDRQAHIDQVKERSQSSYTQAGLEMMGDIAAINSWQYHNSDTGFMCFFTNTPVWVIEIARKHGWISQPDALRFILTANANLGASIFRITPEEVVTTMNEVILGHSLEMANLDYAAIARNVKDHLADALSENGIWDILEDVIEQAIQDATR